jgi:hypothetical protein
MTAAGLIAFLATPAPAGAWNNKGHMVVACVAYNKLTPTTRERVDNLLRRHPDYKKWEMSIAANVSGAEQRLRIFMMAATWPDQIKRSASYTDDGTDNGRRPDGARSSQNIGYGDRLRHRYWHFVDVPFARDGTPLPPIPTPNTQERIHLFRRVLASPAEPEDLKSYDLVWLLHLVGDVHQPLHAATRVSASYPNGDESGGLVTISLAGRKYDLRAFWNTILGGETSLQAAENLAKALPPAPARDAALLDEAIWVRNSFDLAQSQAYAPPIGAGAGPFTITSAYRASVQSVARAQVVLAGERLANVLNAELR